MYHAERIQSLASGNMRLLIIVGAGSKGPFDPGRVIWKDRSAVCDLVSHAIGRVRGSRLPLEAVLVSGPEPDPAVRTPEA